MVVLPSVAKCSSWWERRGNQHGAQLEFNSEGGWAREPSGAGVSLEASVSTFGTRRQSSDSSWGAGGRNEE